MPHRTSRLNLRLALLGVLVVAGSVGASLLSTHISFMVYGDVTYRMAMIIAATIPLCVAPVTYAVVAVLISRLQKANRALDLMARSDPLTGLLNRRAFAEAATARLSDGAPQQMLFADIDHFKRINDSMGHAEGDRALIHAANVLRAEAPAGSIIARIGGEEFALLIEVKASSGGADGDAMGDLVQRIGAGLGRINPPLRTGYGRMTCSFGLAYATHGEPLDGLLLRADRALYAAKDAGRDRMALARSAA